MKPFVEMIGEYQRQAEQIRNRISALSAGIAAAQKNGHQEEAKRLSERRTLLYHEVWEMEESIRSMRTYLPRTGEVGG